MCYSNERVDEKKKAGETVADQTKRQKIYAKVQQNVCDEAPAVSLFLRHF